MAKPDMVAIMDLKLVAYGNTKKNADGSFTCQHGEGECQSDVYELCTQYKLKGDIGAIDSGETSVAAWPFILCMEQQDGNPLMAQSCYEATMKTTALPWSTVSACATKEASDVQNAAASATPKHDYVPWVLVDHTLLDQQSLLQHAICKAYTGTPPASCKGFLSSAPAGACFNDN